MNTPNLEITSDFYRYFYAWVEVSIPSVYTNTFSYYETLSKLVISLNELRDNQNLTSKQMDSLVEQVKTYMNKVRDYLDKYKQMLEKEWNDYREDRIKFEDNFYKRLLNLYRAFIQKLQEIERAFIEEITTFWNEKSTIIHNILEETERKIKELEQKYKDEIENWYTELLQYTNEQLESVENEYIALESDVDKFNTDNKERINREFESVLNDFNNLKSQLDLLLQACNTKWDSLKSEFDSYIDSHVQDLETLRDYYKNLYMDKVKEYTESHVTNWVLELLNNTDLSKGEDHYLFKKITYTGKDEPSTPSTGEIWLKTNVVRYFAKEMNYYILEKYNGNEWEILTDGLYMTNDNHIYYPTYLAFNNGGTIDFKNNMMFAGFRYRDNKTYAITIKRTNTDGEYLTRTDGLSEVISTCMADRGYGYQDIAVGIRNIGYPGVYQSMNNGDIWCYHNANGKMYHGKLGFPCIVSNACQGAVSESFALSDDEYFCVGLNYTDVPVLVDSNYNYKIFSNGTRYNCGKYSPRYLVNWQAICVNTNTDDWYIQDYRNNSQISILDENKDIFYCDRVDNIQGSLDGKYIFTDRYVYLASDVLSGANKKVEPIYQIPSECLQVSIYNDVLIGFINNTENFGTNLLVVDLNNHNKMSVIENITDKFSYNEDWFVYGESVMGIDTTDNTSSHLYQVIYGADEIRYVSV